MMGNRRDIARLRKMKKPPLLTFQAKTGGRPVNAYQDLKLTIDNVNKMRKKNLIIIQNRPTQFDVPLYAEIEKSSNIQLVVFYTEVNPKQTDALDQEIGIPPRWDHLIGLLYNAPFDASPVSLWRKIRALHPDHVIICGWYPRSHAILTLLLKLSGISLGLRSDNTLWHTRLTGAKGFLKRLFMAFWPGVFRSWHPVGTLARDYLKTLSMASRPVYFFPYAVDVDWFIRNTAEIRQVRSEIRKQLGFSSGDYVVMGLMKWSPREDPMTLIEAFIEAAKKIPRVRLLLVGDGELRDKVMSTLKFVPGRWAAPGYISYSQLPKYFAVSDVFVHPAQIEPYGVSIQEAMACGLPVLASAGVGAAQDFIEPDVNGDIFPSGDFMRLSNLIEKWAEPDRISRAFEPCIARAVSWSYRLTLSEFNDCMSGIKKNDFRHIFFSKKGSRL